ncbi:MAG: SDR family NAD(P)-dependent oxidoreductase [Opitutaceae bacterium]|nr:SDR family NAD(P)-dependent oxidoreductase [Opitutaceae bacterium]
MKSKTSRWAGKVALVTGASSGIGAATAVALGALGMRVVLAGRHRARLTATARRVHATGADALVLTGDLARADACRRLFQTTKRRWGAIDVLVNCAGIRGGNSLLATPWHELDTALRLNVAAPLLAMREAVAHMRGKRDAAILTLGSMVGHRVLPGVPALYAATKHALRILSDGLRTELAARRSPIKVALISPGLTDTPWHTNRGGIRRGGKPFPYAPLRPEDVARVAVQILETPRHVQIRDVLLNSSAQPH